MSYDVAIEPLEWIVRASDGHSVADGAEFAVLSLVGGSHGLSEEGVKGALCSAVDLDGTQRRPEFALSAPVSRGRWAASAIQKDEI
ncbi:hypothetical protein Baya_13423 [Bagarius yarrelli]|uniref:Uncharacterized protein n=1 Tax=Bagarius yarrelli TaxID=175774 RepID=A0A556V5K9_BAGYA|nr:hypothetical protein Baya_13423 [Bagarius yarrelli]